jgi:site-specific DNA-methyltransferase (adenine-specific)
MTTDNPAMWVHINDVKPWEDNPRHNDQAVDHVAKSIERFGWGAPIIARRTDGVIIAGHTRHKAAQQLGMDKVLVRYMDLDPAQAAALALADNKLGEIATWDDQGVADILQGLADQCFDLDGLGWSQGELDAILTADPFDMEGATADDDTADSSTDDQIPEYVPTITQAGDTVTIGRHDLHCVDCLQMLRSLPADSVDSIVTDPPYGIGFMGKGWDSSVPGAEFAAECLRVLKPGGHMVAFAATRTVHRLTVNLEDAGFEVRDMIAWLQWQGFPKSHNVCIQIDKHLGAMGHRGVAVKHMVGQSFTAPQAMPEHTGITPEAKRWAGWGTALKPAQEPAILVRKPLQGTIAENVLTHGTGGLNIDAARIPYGDPAWPQVDTSPDPEAVGRWPGNVYHCVKPSRAEREEGCDDLPAVTGAQAVERTEGSAGLNNPRAGAGRTASEVKNNHPTVKPIGLMRWLVRLVTPPGGLVVEPFGGSGTTLIAAQREGMSCIASERDPHYCDIIRARLSAVVDGE